MILDRGKVQEFHTQLLAAKWERQHQERQIPKQLYNHLTSMWEEPTVHERERLLGLEVDDTAVGHHVTLLYRQRLLGKAMDHHVMTWFRAIMETLSFP